MICYRAILHGVAAPEFYRLDGEHFILNESSLSLNEPIIVTTDRQRLSSTSG